MRAGNLRATENIAPCKKEATFRDFLLLKGWLLMQLCDCVALWMWGGLGSVVTGWAGEGGQDGAAGHELLPAELLEGFSLPCSQAGVLQEDRSKWRSLPVLHPLRLLTIPVPVTPLPADQSCSEQSADYFLLKLQTAINFSPLCLASGALKYEFTSPVGFFFFPFLKG